MTSEDREFLFTTAWMFARHGQRARARALCAALVEDDPQGGVAAVAYAELLLADREAESALRVLRAADVPAELDRAEALLESRALVSLGREIEATRRWRRYVEASKGKSRKWVSET